MTVEELIDILKQQDKDSLVIIRVSSAMGFQESDEVGYMAYEGLFSLCGVNTVEGRYAVNYEGMIN